MMDLAHETYCDRGGLQFNSLEAACVDINALQRLPSGNLFIGLV